MSHNIDKYNTKAQQMGTDTHKPTTNKPTKYNSAYKDIKIPKTDYPNEFIQFCEWSVIPKTMRLPKDQKGFARKYGLNIQTLSNWKHLQEYNDNIRQIARHVIGNDLPEIMQVVKAQALKGSSKHVSILLDWLGELEHTTQQGNVSFTWIDNSSTKPKHVDAVDVDTTT